jgi:hypothetical protein
MAKAGKRNEAEFAVTAAQNDRAPPRPTGRARASGNSSLRALAAIGAVLIPMAPLSVGAAGAEDHSTRSEFRLAQSDRDAPVETCAATREGPSAALDFAENAAAGATEDEVPAFAASAAAGSAAEPNDGSATSRPNQLWLVSTRRLPDCPCVHCDTGRADIYRYECGVGWQRSSQEAFLAAGGSDFVTTVFVHGNDTDAEEARDEGHQLYARLTSTACPGAPVRFVIWSWPSERILGRIRSDIQAKACRANADAFYLADFLDGLASDARVSLLGYSLGARVTVGALHLLGGGVLDGRQMETHRHANRPGARVVLIAGAIADDWLQPGMRYERALSQCERLVVMYNPLDAVLRFYPLMYGRGGPNALGYTGIRNVYRLGEDRQKVLELNVSGAVHRGHGWGHYANSPSILCRLRHELLMHDTAPLAQREDVAAGGESVSK